MARNTGMEVATGEYTAFADSDGCMDDAGVIRRMVDQAEEKQADVVVGAFRRFNGQQVSGVNRPRLHDGAYTRTVDFRFKGSVFYGHLSLACSKLYRRAFLVDNNIKHRDYPFMEDKSFNMICCACEPTYAFVYESVYLYRINADSISI